jgi:hypothetical protein
MAKNNKPAEAYAQPHTLSGKSVSGELPAMSDQSGADYLKGVSISVGTVSFFLIKAFSVSAFSISLGSVNASFIIAFFPLILSIQE